ncbi:MAG: SUMF1/EgtB/PvdO family nonheme iron enzyme, partial [Myxococcaceae bacterium]
FLFYYRCGSHVPDSSESCGSCGQKLAGGGVRQATATFSRKRLGSSAVEGAPYKTDDLIANRYQVRDTVGAGPLGFVFRALDKEVDVEVAIKVINPRLVQTPEERRGFAKAIRVGRKLAHPNLLRVYEEGEDQDRPFFTMQFLEGLTLRKIIDLRIAKGQFFALKEIEPIVAQISAALDGAAKLGPHSDLKPENIIVLPDLLKVTDFGVGLAIPRLPFVQAMRPRKADRYLAPEFVEGGEIDGRADIYSMGVILGEMLAGLTPDGAVPELGRRNPEVPPAVEGLYRRALNANPLARFKTAREMFEEFAELIRRVSPPPLKARPEPASGGPPRTKAPGTGGAALQLAPRRPIEKPPPPVPESALSDEIELGSGEELAPPDATQPMDPVRVAQALSRPPPPPPDAREATDVIDSVPLIAAARSEDGSAEHPRPPGKSRAVLWLVLLTLSGLVTGSAGGYWLLQRLRAQQTQVIPVPPPLDPAVEAARLAAEKQAAEDKRLAAEKQAAEDKRLADEKKAAEDKRLAEEKKAAEAKAAEDAKKAALKNPKDRPGKVVPVAAIIPEGGCPDGMRTVAAGSFRMGTSGDDPMRGFDEPGITSSEVGAFCVDQYEYPNRRGVTPTVNVSWNDAKRLCEGKGKRLCTEVEWEKACKGPGNARFPYGNNFDPNACNTQDEAGEDRQLSTSGQFAKCRSGYGVADLSGNIAEWTASPYSANADKTLKGGAFARPDYAARCSARKNGSPGTRSGEVGFRCCADPRK